MPLVAVTATIRDRDGIQRVSLNEAYVRALESAGLVPVVIPPLADHGAIDRILASVDGLVLTGGEDIDPAHYGEEPHATTYAANQRRDSIELALTLAAQRRALPTLAICRGVQVVNVAFGGTLVQDVPSQWPGAGTHDAAGRRDARIHEVRVTPGTRLAGAVDATMIHVNSSHHQAVHTVGEGLEINAVSPDGVVEGVESAERNWWMVGVQWHPEDLVESPDPWDRMLFAAFAEQCAAYHSLAASSEATSLHPAPGA